MEKQSQVTPAQPLPQDERFAACNSAGSAQDFFPGKKIFITAEAQEEGQRKHKHIPPPTILVSCLSKAVLGKRTKPNSLRTLGSCINPNGPHPQRFPYRTPPTPPWGPVAQSSPGGLRQHDPALTRRLQTRSSHRLLRLPPARWSPLGRPCAPAWKWEAGEARGAAGRWAEAGPPAHLHPQARSSRPWGRSPSASRPTCFIFLKDVFTIRILAHS